MKGPVQSGPPLPDLTRFGFPAPLFLEMIRGSHQRPKLTKFQLDRCFAELFNLKFIGQRQTRQVGTHFWSTW